MSLKTKARNTIQEICRICKEKSLFFLLLIFIILLFSVIFSAAEGIRHVNRIAAEHWRRGLDSWCSCKFEEALPEWRTSLLISTFTRREHARNLYWNAKAEKKAGNSRKSARLLKKLSELYPCSYYSLLAAEKRLSLSEYERKYYATRYPLMWADEVRASGAEFNVPPHTIWAIMKQESKFRHNAESRTGATGLMQLMPETASSKAEKTGMETYNLRNPGDNIKIGTSYFSHLLLLSDGNLITALAGYNAGPAAVKAWGKLGAGSWEEWIERIPYPQTCNFVRNVLANNEMYYRIYNNEKAPGKRETLSEKLYRLEFAGIHGDGKEQGEEDDRQNSTGL